MATSHYLGQSVPVPKCPDCAVCGKEDQPAVGVWSYGQLIESDCLATQGVPRSPRATRRLLLPPVPYHLIVGHRELPDGHPHSAPEPARRRFLRQSSQLDQDSTKPSTPLVKKEEPLSAVMDEETYRYRQPEIRRGRAGRPVEGHRAGDPLESGGPAQEDHLPRWQALRRRARQAPISCGRQASRGCRTRCLPGRRAPPRGPALVPRRRAGLPDR
jgi:hypothetical protein